VATILGWPGTAELPDSNLLRTRLTFPVQTGDGDRRRIDGGGAGETGLGLLVAVRMFPATGGGFGGFRIRATGSCRTSGMTSVLTSNLEMDSFNCLSVGTLLEKYHEPCLSVGMLLGKYLEPCLSVGMLLGKYHESCLSVGTLLGKYHEPCLSVGTLSGKYHPVCLWECF
jgi:hypothetical protein